MIEQIKNVAGELFAKEFGDANVLLLAGSVVRGEGTASSDLDVVVLYEHLPAANRNSFEFGGWPIEAFIHDLETLRYFIEKVDGTAGVPSLASMVVQGVEIPKGTALSDEAKKFAEKSLCQGPAAWSTREIDQSRYQISDLIDDMSAPRSTAELYASGARLYERLANHYLRASKQWSATGKSIPRRLREVAPGFADDFELAFERLFARADAGQVIELAEQVLARNGGKLFTCYKLEAPPAWRSIDL